MTAWDRSEVRTAAGVKGQRIEVPLVEGFTITIDRFPSHVGIVNIAFPEGAIGRDWPTLNVPKLVELADNMVEMLAGVTEMTGTLTEMRDELDERVHGVGLLAGNDVDEIFNRLLASAELPRIIVLATMRAQKRARRKVHDDDWYQERADYRSEHGVSETAVKYKATERQVGRWLREARRRGITYKGMRGGS